MEEQLCWICRFCDEHSKYYPAEQINNGYIPKGWVDDEHEGVMCDKCAESRKLIKKGKKHENS